MAIKYLSFKDLTPDRRVSAGGASLAELRRLLNQPGLTDSQRQQIEAKAAKIAGWVHGTLECTPPAVPHHLESLVLRPPIHHAVAVAETLAVEEDTS